MSRKKNLLNLVDKAIKKYFQESNTLQFLADNRYNRRIFSTTGQYDWFSGQLLYFLVRHSKAIVIVEISTSSGCSTLFMALGLKKNGFGKIHTFDMDAKALKAAEKNFKKYKVKKFVKTHLGDARVEIDKIKNLKHAGLYFLDSEHTEEFAQWFIEKLVVPAKESALFTTHDIMPVYAKVRKYNGPPWTFTNLHFYRTLLFKFKSKVEGIDLGLENLKLNIKKPKSKNGLYVYDGNEGSEPSFGNKLVSYMEKGEYLYCYDIADKYAKLLQSRKYDYFARGFQNEEGKPYEWNHSLWAYSGAVKAAYQKFLLT